MNADLRERLRRLGVTKGAAHLKPSTRPREPEFTSPEQRGTASEPPLAAATLEPVVTAFGPAWFHRTVYPIGHAHGDRPLAAALDLAPDALSQLTSGLNAPLRDAIFLDTETTGLAGGSGTLAFLVGLGYFTAAEPTETGPSETTAAAHFVVDQYFLRDPAAEVAMMTAIDQRVYGHPALVTFNGKAFDIPLLETRFVMSRLAAPFSELAHLDLLMPARRMWRGSLASCSLGSLEFHLLGVRRDQQDIAGFLIPQLYREYLQTGDMTDMTRVMYHNLLDILSMVTLAARLSDAFHAPASAHEHLAVARQHARAGAWPEAERAYRAAATRYDAGAQVEIQRQLAQALRRQGRHDDAAEVWEALADGEGAAAVEALTELAKHYEWRATDRARALLCAKRALRLASDALTREALRHRVERLERKRDG